MLRTAATGTLAGTLALAAIGLRSRVANATTPLTARFVARMSSESTNTSSNLAMCCSAEILVVITCVRAPVRNTTAEIVTIALTK